MDELVVGRRYLIRYGQTDTGPGGVAIGLRPFTLVSVGPSQSGTTVFRFMDETNELEFVVSNFNTIWIFFNDLPGAAEAIAAAAEAAAAAAAAEGLHPLIANAPNIGELVLPAGINANVIDMEPFKNDEAVVILQRPLFGDKHIFRESTISEWFKTQLTNPVTRAAITGNGDVVRATIKVPAVGGKRKRHRTYKRMRRSRRSRRRV